MQSSRIIRDLYSNHLNVRAWAASRLHYDETDGQHPHDLLPLLIRSAKSADSGKAKHDAFMLAALRATGFHVNSMGYDSNSYLHREALEWIIQSTVSDNIETAASAIWALGDLGIPPASVRERLELLIVSDARSNGDTPNTCRALALRMLARLDMETALHYIDSPASHELRDVVSYWRDCNQLNGSDAEREFEWLSTA